MVRIEAAGQTMILFKLKLGEMVTTIATIGFNETVEHKNLSFTVWAVGAWTSSALCGIVTARIRTV